MLSVISFFMNNSEKVSPAETPHTKPKAQTILDSILPNHSFVTLGRPNNRQLTDYYSNIFPYYN